MSRIALVGGEYQSQSPAADAESLLNAYVEVVESGQGKSAQVLYQCPGLKIKWTLPEPSVRGMFVFKGRQFAVAGVSFYELIADGTFQNYGAVANDGLPASIIGGPGQILVASAGVMYVFELATNALSAVDATTYVGPVQQVTYVDGFYVALFKNSGEFQVSAPDDATSWDLTNVAIVSVYGDNVVAMGTAYRQLWFFGSKKSVVYYDSGSLFPFSVFQSGFIEQGSSAVWAVSLLNESLFWIGADERGGGIAYRANGYAAQRVSDHSAETAWSKFPAKTSDAISYAYQDQGHIFWVIYFPSGNATWCFDVATGEWHKRSFFDSNTGKHTAHRSQCHAYQAGVHYVGDWASGNIYAMDVNFNDNFGHPRIIERVAPVVSVENQSMFHSRVELDAEMGLAPQPPLLDGSGNPRGAEVRLCWSDDSGHTYGNWLVRSLGQAGNFRQRTFWDRLGTTRHRNYKLQYSDPAPFRGVDFYLLATGPGTFAPQERYQKQISKIA